MSPDEFVQLLLGDGVQILELVQRRELLHVEPVGRDHVRLPLQQMLRLVPRYIRHGGEHVRQVGGRPLHAVPVVDLPLACLLVHVELVQVVVEVRVAGAQVPPQQGGVRREHRRHVHVARAQRYQADARLPLVEVGDHLRGRAVAVAFGRVAELK